MLSLYVSLQTADEGAVGKLTKLPKKAKATGTVLPPPVTTVKKRKRSGLKMSKGGDESDGPPKQKHRKKEVL